MPDCIFCKITQGEIPAAKIWEDEKYLAILDINPNTKGMTLVLTKEHYDSYAFEMPDDVYASFMAAAKTVSRLLERALGVQRVALVMEGLGVNHAHLKLYPLHGLSEKFTETWAPQRVYFEKYHGYLSTQLGPQATPDALKALAEEIRKKNGL
ncbi:HIT domain-containing protein [Candidatus Uhrbacteria bacterium]|nr:HIT domain-containing protein [Candidatus Uhrbacteria bacterium]